MISIIVSSYNEELFTAFTASVAETIGTIYEIIRIYNPGKMGVCEAYNRGIAQAIYPYLCFSHEDIIFHTPNWGLQLIQDIDSDPKIGLIGIAGSAYKTWVVSGWHSSQPSPTKFYAENYRVPNGDVIIRKVVNQSGKNLVPVATVDGCFMFTRKQVTNAFKFDQALFKSYHCYDTDFSLQLHPTYKVMVGFTIELTHLSAGKFDRKWLVEAQKLHHKWADKLPVAVLPATYSESSSEEEHAFYGLTSSIFAHNYGHRLLWTTVASRKFYKLVGRAKLTKILRMVYRIKGYYP